MCYTTGKGVARDLPEAVAWYRRSADQGHADAQSFLGLCYGVGQGVAQDLSEAVAWFRRAADQGHATAQRSLATCYYKGEGVAPDLSEAVAWYRRAADQGDAVAQCSLGMCYHAGQGVAQDFSEAAAWLRRAADQGHAEAQFGLGKCYHAGQGVARDQSEAVRWFRCGEPSATAETKSQYGMLLMSTGDGVAFEYGAQLVCAALPCLEGALKIKSIRTLRSLGASVPLVCKTICLSCGTPCRETRAQQCTLCKVARFCNKQCLHSAWPVHKEHCKRWRRDR